MGELQECKFKCEDTFYNCCLVDADILSLVSVTHGTQFTIRGVEYFIHTWGYGEGGNIFNMNLICHTEPFLHGEERKNKLVCAVQRP